MPRFLFAAGAALMLLGALAIVLSFGGIAASAMESDFDLFGGAVIAGIGAAVAGIGAVLRELRHAGLRPAGGDQ